MAVDVTNFERYTVHPANEDGHCISFEGGESVYGTASYGYIRRLLKQSGVEIPEVDRFEEPEQPAFNFVDPSKLSEAATRALTVLSESENPSVDGELLFEDRQEDFSPESYAERQNRQCRVVISAMRDWSDKGLYTVVFP